MVKHFIIKIMKIEMRSIIQQDSSKIFFLPTLRSSLHLKDSNGEMVISTAIYTTVRVFLRFSHPQRLVFLWCTATEIHIERNKKKKKKNGKSMRAYL